MKMRTMLPLLLVAASLATPASANWFSNPIQGVNRFIGSAPNPKPEDIRLMRTIIVTKDEKATPAPTNQSAAVAPAAAADGTGSVPPSSPSR